MDKPSLSILIASVTERTNNLLAPLLSSLHDQVKDLPIEILVFGDNRQRSIGSKRQGLLSLAAGEYVSYIDDDDMVSDYYCEELLKAIDNNPGVELVSFDMCRETPWGEDVICRHVLGTSIGGFKSASGVCVCPPTHLCAWKRSLVKDIEFEDISWEEDLSWSMKTSNVVNFQFNIPKVLYWYRMGITKVLEKGIEWKSHGRHLET